MRAVLFGALVLSAGCLKSAAFNCANDTQCGTGGVCEPEGLCSVVSGSCSSGREFDSSAGSKAGTCVGGDTPTDGPAADTPTDTVGIDMAIDAPQGCQAGYNTITNGQTNHKYMLVTTKDQWSNQHNTVCVTSGGYLTIPDSAAELQAVFDLDMGNNGDMWVGVTDGPGNGQEGTFKDVLGNAYDAAAKVGAAVGANNQTKDCVKTTNGTTLTADACATTFIAVCECEQ